MKTNKLKGSGTIKKLRTGMVISVLSVSAIFGVSTANADEVSTQNVDTVNATVSTVDDDIVLEDSTSTTNEETTTVITDEHVVLAEKTVESANAQVTSQEEVVNNIQKEIDTNDSTIKTKESELEEAKAVTPEVVNTAKAVVTSDETALKTADESVTPAKTTKEESEKLVSDQTKVVEDAQKTVDTATEEVSTAQKTVDSLSQSSDIASLETKVAELKTTVGADEQAVAKAEQDLENAKTATTNKEEAISKAKESVASAQKTVDTSANGVSEAKAIDTTTSEALKTAEDELVTAKAGTTEKVQTGTKTVTTGGTETLKSNVAHSNFFNLDGMLTSDAYITAIKNLANGTGTVADVTKAIKEGIQGNSLSDIASANPMDYDASSVLAQIVFPNTDSTTKYDVLNLPDSVVKELSLFYAALLNDMRAKVGTDPVKVTEASLLNARQNVTDIFNSTNNTYSRTHTDATFYGNTSSTDESTRLKAVPGNASAAVKSTLGSDTIIVNTVANEDYQGTSTGLNLTMEQLKRQIYFALGNQLYRVVGNANGGMNGETASNYTAALRVLGLDGKAGNSVGLDSALYTLYNGHINRAANYVTTFSNTTDSAITNPYTNVTGGTTTTEPVYETKTVVDSKAVETAQAKYDAAKSASDTAKSELATAQANYESAKYELATAQSNLSDIQSGTVDIKSLETALETAKTNLASDKSALGEATKSLESAKATDTEKAELLATAKENLDSAKTKLSSANGVLENAKSRLAELNTSLELATKAYEDATSKVATAKEKLSKDTAEYERLSKLLENKDATITKLSAEIQTIKDKQISLYRQLVNEREILEALKLTAKEAKDSYDELMYLKAQQDKALADEKAKALSDEKSKDMSTTTKSNTVVAPVSYNTTSTTPTTVTKSSEKVLPNTSSDNGLATASVGLVSVLGALGLMRKRKEN